jgi:HlyD family secretion protein
MKIFTVLLVVVLICTGFGTWYWRVGQQEVPQFRELPVERGELLITVSATGTVEPVEVIDVGAQIIGRIQSFGPDLEKPGNSVDYCSGVKEGAVLANLDDSPYQIELERARANLKLAEAELSRYRAQLNQAKQDFDRASQLRDTNSKRDYDMAVAQHEMAKADVEVGQARVEQAQLAVKEAEVNLSYTVIRAPIDGVVIDRRVNVGQTVVAGLNAPSLFLLAKDLSRMQVWAAVNEADISDVYVGQRVTFKVDAYRDQTFVGTVSQIRLDASMSHNVVIYGVVIDIDNTDGKLLPYMTASIQFEVARRSDVLLVPNQALRWRPTPEQITPAARSSVFDQSQDRKEDEKIKVESPTVWVLAEDGLVRPVEVGVGLSDGIVTEITEGDVEPGAKVVATVIRQAQRDFVSSFISRVVKSGE